MKILWSSNSPHSLSGYGVQSRFIVEGLQRMGHEVALAPNYGFQGGAVEANGTRIYPLWREKIGQDVLPYHALHWGAELVVTLYDLWPYDSNFAARLKVPWACYFPQDSYPPCPTTVERAQQADYPIAMSKFGVESMAEQGVDCHYIPHGVDTTVYSPGDKAAARDELKLPQDKFIVLMVAANQSFPSRKAFPENLSGFAKFHKEHPDSLLYLHTTRMPRGQAWDGIELDRLIHALGIQDAVVFTDEYRMVLGLPDEDMAKIYNAADVLLSASMGEGFGVPIIEAQSCGLPVITTDFSAMPEITFNGVKVKPIQESWIAINTWQALPPIAGIHQALNIVYEQPAEDKRKASQNARQRIIQDYSWPVVVEAWRVLLEDIESNMPKPIDVLTTQAPLKAGDVVTINGKECEVALINGQLMARPVTSPSPERLYHVNIKGIEFDAFEDKQSFTVDCVQGELRADTYKFEDVEIRPGDVILDIGAHVGVFSIYCAKKYPEARIIAYEPSPTNYDRLIRNLEAAGVTNVEPHNLAVTADGRDIELSLERGNTGGTSAMRKVNGHLVEKAKSTTLDTIIDDLSGPFVGEIQRVRFLKIDAEGCEHEVLLSTNYLDRVDYLAGEFHINSFLKQQGYSIAELYKHCTQVLGPQRVTHTSCQMDE